MSSEGHARKGYSNILKNTRKRISGKPDTDPKHLERHMKGIANHWRIAILLAVGKHDGITLDQLVQQLDGNVKTISEHTRRLTIAGLMRKKYVGTSVSHSLTPYGERCRNFLLTF
ncbi:MAG TPA: helix-turn-helix transcriptional regulator [Candidatus Paceibacterota bacterium]